MTMHGENGGGHWSLVASRGAKGNQGAVGLRGDQGPAGPAGPAGPPAPRFIEFRMHGHELVAIDEEGQELRSDATELIRGVRDAVIDMLRIKGLDV